MFRADILTAAACMLCVPCATDARTYSWGLPGSSRTTFESGNRECALDVARRDVSAETATKKYLRGHEVLERENNMPPMPGVGMEDDGNRGRRQVLIRQAYRPEKHVDSLQDQLQREMNACLIQAGYIRFLLSEEQEQNLARFKAGSESRKRYLHALGSDPDIVMSQKVPS